MHALHKAQRSRLPPADEDGVVAPGTATTENPYFEVNSALLSRARVYELEPLTADQVRVLLDRALERGECGDPARVDPAALEFLAQRSGGDARIALNSLELACESAGGTVTLA